MCFLLRNKIKNKEDHDTLCRRVMVETIAICSLWSMRKVWPENPVFGVRRITYHNRALCKHIAELMRLFFQGFVSYPALACGWHFATFDGSFELSARKKSNQIVNELAHTTFLQSCRNGDGSKNAMADSRTPF